MESCLLKYDVEYMKITATMMRGNNNNVENTEEIIIKRKDMRETKRETDKQTDTSIT